MLLCRCRSQSVHRGAPVPRRQYLSAKFHWIQNINSFFALFYRHCTRNILSIDRQRDSSEKSLTMATILSPAKTALSFQGLRLIARTSPATLRRALSTLPNNSHIVRTPQQQHRITLNASELTNEMFTVHPRPTLLPLQAPLPPPQLPAHPLPRHRHHDPNPSQPRRLRRKPRVLQRPALGHTGKRRQ